MSLFEHAATFLEAEGWQVDRLAKGKASMVGSREYLGRTEYVTVWCPSPEDLKSLRSWEPSSLRRFAEDRDLPGHKVLLLDSQEGLSNEYRQQTSAFNVTLQAPIEFFDAQFCWDDNAPKARRVASAGRRLHDEGIEIAKRRTPQPYQLLGGDSGPDLLEELTRRFESSAEWDRPIILVTAPAGHGKTWLFQSLFAQAHQHFKWAKNHRERARRPLPLLPDYVAQAGSTALPSLVEQFLRADVSGSMPRPRFEWMLNHGYACWMLDGLDEVIASDPNFFDYIEEIIVGADKVVTPRILICARDSLLSTSDGLRNLISDVDSPITQFQLVPWGHPSIETFARMRLTRDDWKMTSLLKHPQIAKLCGTPYYCDLIARRIEDNTLGLPTQQIDETELVNDAIKSIVDREYDKRVLSEQVSYSDIRMLIRDAAVWQLRDAPRGIATERLAEEAEILLMEHDDAERKRFVNQILKLSVFGSDPQRDHVRFAHDSILEYLIGEQAIAFFPTQSERLVQLLDHQGFGPDSVTLRLLVQRINLLGTGASDTLRDLIDLAAARRATTAFRNLICIALQVRDSVRLLKECTLDNADLSKLTFANRVFDGVSMRDANLESTTFERCDLTGLDLSGAMLNNTNFSQCRQTLHAADYGDLSGFVSVIIDGKQILDTHDQFAGFIRRNAKKQGINLGPCATAEQTRKLFVRFLHPNGTVRRASLERARLLRNIKAASSDALLDAVIKSGFLARTPGRELINCTTGPLLPAMAGFVRRGELSPEIKSMLDMLCPMAGCVHTRQR